MWDNFFVTVAAVVAASIVVVGVIWGAMAAGHRYRCKKHEWEPLLGMEKFDSDTRAAGQLPSEINYVFTCKHCGKVLKIRRKA